MTGHTAASAVAAIVLVLGALALSASHAIAQAPAVSSEITDTLKRMEQSVSKLEGISAEFIQHKKLAAFQDVVELKGRIYMKRPDKLAWHVDEPIRYSILITGQIVRQWDEETGQTREMAVSSNPMLGAALNQMTAWFTGKYLSLLEDYEVKLLKRSPIRLQFIPKKNQGMGKAIKSVTIELQEDEKYLREIVIDEAGGDNSTLIFTRTSLKPPEDLRVFEVDALVR